METSFSFTMIWSLYLSISGQAILSAFGLFRLAETINDSYPQILLKQGQKKFLVRPRRCLHGFSPSANSRSNI